MTARRMFPRLLPILALSAWAPGHLSAAGRTAVVRIDRVEAIEVEERRIVLRGDAVVEVRAMTTEKDGDHEVFGRPARRVEFLAPKGVFEVVPYFSGEDIRGVPTGGHTPEALREMSERWWVGTLARGRGIRVGDGVTIGYQGSRTTFNGFAITAVKGYGSLEVRPGPRAESGEDEAARGEAPAPPADPAVDAEEGVRATAVGAALRPLMAVRGWVKEDLHRDHWPRETLARAGVQPLRIYRHQANPVLVTSMRDGVEEGYYVYHPLSSLLPGNGGGWTFMPAAEGVWRYRRELPGGGG